VTVTQVLSFQQALPRYAVIVLLYLFVRSGFFMVALKRLPGRKVPMVNPFRWFTLSEDEMRYTLRQYTLFSGSFSESVFTRYKGTSGAEVKSVLRFPEVRRLFFHSYGVIAERIGSVLILSDPLRENGYLYYPPHYKQVEVTIEDQP